MDRTYIYKKGKALLIILVMLTTTFGCSLQVGDSLKPAASIEASDSDGQSDSQSKALANSNIIVVTLEGASSGSVAPVVQLCAAEKGMTILPAYNWYLGAGDTICSDRDVKKVLDAIVWLVKISGKNITQLNLLIVGKSAGGVLAWNTMRSTYPLLQLFRKISMVTVDAHGSVLNDGKVGPYEKGQNLWWPGYWPVTWRPTFNKLRVYNIYQHQDILTGASFPSAYISKNIKLYHPVDHWNIPNQPATKSLIKEAIDFLKY